MNQKKAPWHFLLLLILAGESIFIIPFVLSRVFRPTVLEAFSLDNVQLGLCFSIYGIIALLSYFFGGPLADKFPPRWSSTSISTIGCLLFYWRNYCLVLFSIV